MDYFKRYETKTKNITKEMDLANQVYDYFGKKLNYPMIMKFIKEKGYKFIFETLSEVKQSRSKNEVALFMWKIKNQKILWTK